MKKIIFLTLLISTAAHSQVYIANQQNCYYEVVYDGQYYCTDDPSYYGYQGYQVYTGAYYGGYYPGYGYYNNNLRQDAQNAYNNQQIRNDISAAAQNPQVRNNVQNTINNVRNDEHNNEIRPNINSIHVGGRR